MTRDEIIRMAREANILEPIDFLESNQWLPDTIRELERFAALVISHHNKTNRPKPDASEREWLQQIAYQHGGIGDLCQTEFEFGAMVAAAERDKYEAKFKQLEALMHVREQQPNKPCCLAEREACAKVCASLDETDMRSRYDYRRGVLDCVDAIRARGKQNDL